MNERKNEINRLGYNLKTLTSKIPICVDFDGTLVEHEYPNIGKTNGNCIEILNKWINEYNCLIILDTMRSDEFMDEALKWCEENGLSIYGAGINPTQKAWTNSNKAYGMFSVDDRNIGCPLLYDKRRPRVDWDKVNEIFEPILKKLNE